MVETERVDRPLTHSGDVLTFDLAHQAADQEAWWRKAARIVVYVWLGEGLGIVLPTLFSQGYPPTRAAVAAALVGTVSLSVAMTIALLLIRSYRVAAHIKLDPLGVTFTDSSGWHDRLSWDSSRFLLRFSWVRGQRQRLCPDQGLATQRPRPLRDARGTIGVPSYH